MSDGRAGRVADAALVAWALALPLSIAASEILLGVVYLAWAATRPWTRSHPPGWRLLAVLTAVLAATWIVASLTAADPWASLVKARKLWSLPVVLVVAERASIAGGAARAGRLAAAGLLGAFLSAGFGVASFAADRVTRAMNIDRLSGFFSTAMTSGNVFATLAVASLGEIFAPAAVRAAGRVLAALALTALLPALLVTYTRSSWLAFLAGAFVLLARVRPRLTLALAACAVLVVAVGPGEIRARAASVVDPTESGNAGRLSLWKSGAAALADHPWTGVGLADHYALIESYRRPDATFHAGHFHSNLVQVAVSTGLVGLAAYLAWMGALGVLLVRAARGARWSRAWVGLAIWAAFQVHGLFDWCFGDAEVANQFLLWAGLGLAAAGAEPAAAP